MEATVEASPATGQRVRGQAPLVESVSCYCRVDAGLKTVAGATKLVPGAKLCLQPDILPNGPKPRNRGRRRSTTLPPLLPDLPDDLAIACLIRVPRADHQNLRLVCRRWNHLLSKNYFFSLRSAVGMAEEWVYVFKRDRDGKISWHAFDPICHLWLPLPPVPAPYSEALGFGCAVLNGCNLYLFGGKDPLRGSMNRVVFYNARTNKWLRAPNMLCKRHFSGSCVLNNCLYVAGGQCEGIHGTLQSAEVYDPSRNKWAFIGEMSNGMVPLIGAVYEEKWFLKGLDSHRQVVGEVYEPSTNSWSAVNGGMVVGWRNPSISMNGRLYSSDCRDGCKLRIYDGATDSWRRFMDSKLHLGSSQSSEAAAFVSLNGKLAVVRNNMGISLVDVSSDPGMSFETNSAHLWEAIAGRGQLKNFVSNLWSTIAGRAGLRSHIVHCQVLQV